MCLNICSSSKKQRTFSDKNIGRISVKGKSSKLTLSLIAVTFCRLLINLANSLDPDQDPQNVDPDLGPNCLII